jgi:hypothetical protein
MFHRPSIGAFRQTRFKGPLASGANADTYGVDGRLQAGRALEEMSVEIKAADRGRANGGTPECSGIA